MVASRLDGSAAAGGHGINAQRPHSDVGIGAAGQCTTSGCTTKTGAAFVAPYLITRACQWIITSRCRMKELIMILQTQTASDSRGGQSPGQLWHEEEEGSVADAWGRADSDTGRGERGAWDAAG